MAPAGRQGYYPKATIGTPKGDRVDHNRTTPSMEDKICYLNWVTHTWGLSYNWWVLEVGGLGLVVINSQGLHAPPIFNLQSGLYCNSFSSK